MKEREFELSRRTILASIGGVGVASVAGGLGTSAFFSDREEFRNNRLVAGELDLKVDWEEHYSDWSPDEVEGLEFEPVMDLADIPTSDPGGLLLDPTDPDNWMAFPPGGDELLYVYLLDVPRFMDNTAVDAYPDSDGDGVQDTIETRQQVRTDNPGLPETLIEQLYRAQFADVPDDLQGRPPLVDLDDVKPGDFGEVTFSFHLFDNPGYIWLTGGLVEAAENGHTEPEANDADEAGPPDEVSVNVESARVELLDEIRVAVWHDDGNNVLTDPEVVVHRKPLDGADAEENISLSPAQALVFQGTLREVLTELSNGLGFALDSDPRTAERDCYPNSTTRFLGFSWWLPVDHANEVQTDSVTFDLGFYTEQCRHNDGSGQAREGGSVMPSSVTVTAAEETADVSTNYRVEVTVGDDIAGATLNELVVDYPSDFDAANVDPGSGDIVVSGVEDGVGIIGANVTDATTSDSNTTVTFAYGSPLAGLSTGDTILLEYRDVRNASSPGTYTVDVTVNGTDVGSDTLEIT